MRRIGPVDDARHYAGSELTAVSITAMADRALCLENALARGCCLSRGGLSRCQGDDREHHPWIHSGLFSAVNFSANSMARIKLYVEATPVPAISKAVP